MSVFPIYWFYMLLLTQSYVPDVSSIPETDIDVLTLDYDHVTKLTKRDQQVVLIPFDIAEEYSVLTESVGAEGRWLTRLEVDRGDGLQLCGYEFLAGIESVGLSHDPEVIVHRNQLLLAISFDWPSQGDGSAPRLSGTLTYQLADDSRCFAPRQLRFSVLLEFEEYPEA